MSSDTPRTDGAVYSHVAMRSPTSDVILFAVTADFARALERELNSLRALIADDAYAMTFQTMGQYRTALLASAPAEKAHKEEPLRDRVEAAMRTFGPPHISEFDLNHMIAKVYAVFEQEKRHD